MLHAATRSVSAIVVQVTLPNDVRYSGNYRNYAFYSICGLGDTDAVLDLGSAPNNGDVDPLGNRPVVHSNVNGVVASGVTITQHDGGPGSRSVSISIPNAINNKIAAQYYNAELPVPVQGTITYQPRYNRSYQSCIIKCSISGTAKAFQVDVSVDLGQYISKTGKVEETVSGRLSVVLTSINDSWRSYYAQCGRKSVLPRSKVGVTCSCTMPQSVGSLSTQHLSGIIGGFKPPIASVQLLHSYLAVSRLTNGDSKAILDAFEGMRLASFNGLAFIRDTSRFNRDTSRLIKDIRRVRKDPRRLASIWLSYRYGHRLYFKDCQEIAKAVTKAGRQRPLKFRGRHVENLILIPGTTTRVEYNFTLYVSAHCLTDLSLVGAIRSLDFWPSAENLWDLIPYSFVADWFLNLSDICRRYDASNDILRFPIKGALQSVKISTRSVSNSNHGSGYADVTYYARLPLTPAALSTTLLSMSLSLTAGISLLHSADALALAVAKKR